MNEKFAIMGAASSQNSLAGESVGEPQTVARVNLGRSSSNTSRKLFGSTCDNPEILGDEVLPKNEKN